MAHQSGPSGASSSAAGPQEEYTVRIPRDTRKKFTMMKFRSGINVDFTKLGEQPVKLERENNLKEYKTANDLDMMPKFGAGSEYGRDQKEESRRKKYGIMLKKYNPEDQPWLMKIGNGKQAKKYKGVREGTISENTSYFVFTKAADGAFEAYPVEKWYNFSPMIRYKYLNSEEAEEEYNKRHKNYFSIMQRYKVKTKEEDNAEEEAEKGPAKGKKDKQSGLILTDMEDWDAMQMSDEDNRDDDDDEKEDDDDAKPKKKKKGKPKGKGKKKKNSKQNSDEEAVEESDEGDYDDREVDYMSDSGSDSSLSGPEGDAKDKKYDEKGVDQEDGLRNILDSGEEEDEEEAEVKEELEEDGQDKEGGKDEKKKGDDDSSSSSSEDDSEFEKEGKLASLFLQDQKPEKKDKTKTEGSPSDTGVKPEASSSPLTDKQKSLKRKADRNPDGKGQVVKKQRPDDSDGITEDAIRRYLMRKPMTTKDLFLKFKSKKLNMSNEKITHVIAQLLKKINPDKNTINKRLYLSLKKPE